MKTSEKLGELSTALAKAQADLRHPAKNRTAKILSAKGNYSYKYADLADVLDCIRAPFSKNGLAIAQTVATENAGVVVTTRLLHSSGEWIEDALWMRLGDDRPQTLGSIITYLRRYSLGALAGIAPDDDEDGEIAQQAASGQPLDDKAPRARARAKENGDPVLKPVMQAAKGGYDTNDKEKHAWLHRQMLTRNIPEKHWDAIDRGMTGLASDQLNRVIAEEMGAM